MHNLVWKLAGVDAGWLAPEMLDTYEAERKPVAQFNCDQSMHNAFKMVEIPLAFGFGDDVAESVEVTSASEVLTVAPLARRIWIWVDSGAKAMSQLSAGTSTKTQRGVPKSTAGAKSRPVTVRLRLPARVTPRGGATATCSELMK